MNPIQLYIEGRPIRNAGELWEEFGEFIIRPGVGRVVIKKDDPLLLLDLPMMAALYGYAHVPNDDHTAAWLRPTKPAPRKDTK